MHASLSIYVLIDGLGWELLRARPFLDDVLPNRRWLGTVLGYGPAATASLLTGLPPSQHGAWSSVRRTWNGTTTHSLANGAASWRRSTQVAVRAPAQRDEGCVATYPLAYRRFVEVVPHGDLFGPGRLHVATAFDMFERHDVPYECYSAPDYPDATILQLARTRAAESDARVLVLRLADLDAFLHRYLHDADGVARQVAWYEEGLRGVWRTAVGRREDVRLFVFSAHGVTPVRWRYDLRRDVETLGLRVPDDYLPVYHPTMARFWVSSERAQRALGGLLTHHPCGRLVPSDELERLGSWFGGRSHYDLLFVATPGALLAPPSRDALGVAGMHGYHPSEPTADGVLLASAPMETDVDHVTGVCQLIAEDLGVPVN